MTTKRFNEIQTAAQHIVAEYGIRRLDALPPVERGKILRRMRRELMEQTGCVYSTAREHIARACRRLRSPLPEARQQPEVITVPQAADETGISPVTIRAAIRRGEITAKKIGRDWLMDEKSFRAWVKNRPRPGPK